MGNIVTLARWRAEHARAPLRTPLPHVTNAQRDAYYNDPRKEQSCALAAGCFVAIIVLCAIGALHGLLRWALG